MCFSANASFTASALLALASCATLSKVKQNKQYLFAAIPLFFAIQQAAEGILWLSFSYQPFAFLQTFAMYTFLFFAFILWPLWIPLSVRLFEPDEFRKKLLNICVLIGCAIAGYLFYLLATAGAAVLLEQNHIVYTIPSPLYVLIPAAIVYALATILPFFISSKKLMWLFGSLLLASYIVAWIFYEYAFVSVWCFFTAILSIVVYAAI